MNLNRRSFLKTATTSFVAFISVNALGLWTRTGLATAAKESPLPAGESPVSESDPVAQAIGYKANVKDIDFKKYPKRKEAAHKNDFCKSCALYTASNDSWGKCSMLTKGVVAANGWCGSWSKRA